MEKQAFSESPLITPERLSLDIASVFNDDCKPSWVSVIYPLDDDSCFLTIKNKTEKTILIDNITLASIYELTRFRRYGGGVVFNRTKGIWYLKVTFGKPNFTAGRLVLSADKGKAVSASEAPINSDKKLPSILPKYDFRPENLFTQGAGQANLAARTKAIGYAPVYAIRNAPKGYDIEGYDIEGYIANLHALFLLHDKTYGPAV